MLQKLRENWQLYLGYGVVGIWIIAFVWILSASRQCGDSGAMRELTGLCLLRRVAGISCILGIELTFGVVAGLQTRAKGYGFLLGFLLGFFGSALGGYVTLALGPKAPKGTPTSPETRRKRVILVVIITVTTLLMVLVALGNLGRI